MAKCHERMRIGESAIGVTTVIDEIHFAEVVAVDVEKLVATNLQKLMLLLGRQVHGITS